MPFISFKKASDPAAPDDLRVNTAAVLYVEESRPDLAGHTTIHVLGQGALVNAVLEPVGTVVHSLSIQGQRYVAATRHYLATLPEDGPSTVYINPENVSFLRPNLPASHSFWYVNFVDGSQLRILDPLPDGL